MVRTFIRKTDRGIVNSAHLYSAVRKEFTEKNSLSCCYRYVDSLTKLKKILLKCKKSGSDLSAVVENPTFSSSIGGYKLKTGTC